MLLKKIKAQNVYSFANIEVDLCSERVTQITGLNLDERRADEDSVNGIGKTNLYNLVTQCLYSRDIFKTAKSFLSNMFCKGDFKIELWIDDLVVVYTKSDCKIMKDGNVFLTGRSTVTDYFEGIIPFELFLPLTYISSSIYFPFFDATPKQQKDFMGLVFSDLMSLKNAIPVLKEERSEVNKELLSLSGKIKVYEELANVEIKEVIKRVPEIPELINYDEEMKELLKRIREAENLNYS